MCRHRACASVGLSRPRRRTRSTPSHNLIKALATCGRGRPKSAVGGFGSRQPTTIVGCNCHEIIGKALLCVRCRRWKHSSQVSGAALKMLASLKGGQAVELLGRAIYSKYAAPSFRCAPSILAAGWAHVLQWPDRQLFVCVDPPRKMLASLKGGQAVELLGRAIYSKYAAPSFRCAPSILAAGWAHVLQWPDRQLFVCVSILLEQRSEHVGSTPQWQNCAKWG